MTLKTQQDIIDGFPKIFQHESCSPTPYSTRSFEYGSGWNNIVFVLASTIQHYIDDTNKTREEYLNYKQMIGTPLEHLIPPYLIRRELSGFTDIDNIPEQVQQVVCTQIKEKFGTLRFYYNGGDDAVDNFVRIAESLTGVVCEHCGVPSSVASVSGFMTTMCKNCLSDQYSTHPPRKILINDKIGGYTLPNHVKIEYLESMGMRYVIEDDMTFLVDVNDMKSYFGENDIDRDDDVLICIIEELFGDSGSQSPHTQSSRLKIVEIPCDVDWYLNICDDGTESVHERNRVWQ